MAHQIKFTILESHNGTLSKEYRLNGDGRLNVKPAGNLTHGIARLNTVDSMAEFSQVLQSLKDNQALTFGITERKQVKVMSQKTFDEAGRPDDVVTRTMDNFKWPDGSGFLMLDYDPEQGKEALTRNQLIKVIEEVCPEITNAAYVWWCSASSHIYKGEQQLQGLRGQRMYIAVKDAFDIKQAGEILAKRLWLAGYGRFQISRAGTALPRTLIDTSVWQTNRLDFAAGAVGIPPLEQRRGKPLVHEGDLLDTVNCLPDLTDAEEDQFRMERDKALAKVQQEMAKARQEYIDSEARKKLNKDGAVVTEESMAQLRSTLTRAVDNAVLSGDFMITLDTGTTVTVGQMMDNPSKYHGSLTLDPLEPEYNGHKVVGKVYLIGGRPVLHSQAHGGKTYKLIRQPHRIEHIPGKTADTVDKTLERMRYLSDVFDMGDSLVRVNNGRARSLDVHGIKYYLGQNVQFYVRRAGSRGEFLEKDIDPLNDVANQMLSMGRLRGLKKIKAVITAPVITPDGRVISRGGYDEKSQLYLDMLDAAPPVPHDVDDRHLKRAYSTLMRPFNDFAVATPIDRAVLLAAIFTAIVRPALDTAPAFGMDAPVQGSGKTYLAQCLAALSTGRICAVMPPLDHRQDDETRKRIISALDAGDQVLIWDNVLGAFDSASSAALLTSPTFSDRILGKSEKREYPNRLLFLVTGNNLQLVNDMTRRVLVCRIDPGVENPATRKFKMQPMEYILQNRQLLVQAGLTLIRAYLQSDEAAAGGAVSGESTASFEQWDKLVRQTVAWLALQDGLDALADPADALKQAVAYDPEKETWGVALSTMREVMGGKWFTAKDLLNQMEQEHDNLSDESALYSAIQDVVPDVRFSPLSLGRVLSHREGRIVNGMRLLIKRTRNGAQFCITLTDE